MKMKDINRNSNEFAFKQTIKAITLPFLFFGPNLNIIFIKIDVYIYSKKSLNLSIQDID